MEIAFKDLPLGAQFPLIVKSIHKEASLQTLDFSGCSFEDDGLKVVNTDFNLTLYSNLLLICSCYRAC
jgi:hypothetical protein